MLRHWGYKPVFIFGLCTYAIGALMMWPSGVYRSFGGFCAATFICGSGLGSLETAANPYLAVCGPPKYSEIRINFAQAFNGIGTVVAPALASYVFFKHTEDDVSALKNVQWVYLAVACFAFFLAVAFFLSHIPEVTDADMEFQVQETHITGTEKPFIKQYRLFHAAFAQFCYVGAQVAVATWFINYATESTNVTASTASSLLAGAQAAFTVGRFSGTGLMRLIRPRLVFLFYLGGVIVALALATGVRGRAGIAMLYITLFFESVCFPTIVALGIRGLGRHYKRGSGYIVGAVIGGGCVPALQGKVADIHNSTPLSMVVALMVSDTPPNRPVLSQDAQSSADNMLQ
jgi:MFS transporter, FHS family, L-fucose permease